MGSLSDKSPTGRKPVLSADHLNFIDAKVEENDELTATGKSSIVSFTVFVIVSSLTL